MQYDNPEDFNGLYWLLIEVKKFILFFVKKSLFCITNFLKNTNCHSG